MRESLGLDGELDDVELVGAVEDKFDITLDDAGVESILTVGELYAAVLALTRQFRRDQKKCPSAMAFYRIRQMLPDKAGCGRTRRCRTRRVVGRGAS